MPDILSFITSHIVSLASAGLGLSMLIYGAWFSLTQKFWWMDFKYAFPVIGGLHRAIARRERKPVHDDVTGQTLTQAQTDLLTRYYDQINPIRQATFERAYQFILLAKQADRSMMPAWGMPVIFLLLTAEAVGFGILLAPVIAQEVTPNIATVVGLLIAFLLAVIAASLTHLAGSQIYLTGLINKNRRIANDDKVEIYKKAIPYDADQNEDALSHDSTRFGNRVLESRDDKGSYAGIVIAAIYIIAVLGGSTWLRYEDLKVARANDTTMPSTAGDPGMTMGSNPFANETSLPMPPDVTQNADQTRQDTKQYIHEAEMSAGVAGIISLGVIFVFTQILAMTLGLRYGHAHRKRVSDAYKKGTLGFSSYTEYQREILNPRIRRAEHRLQQLTSGLFRDSAANPFTISFATWLHEKMEKESQIGNTSSRIAPANLGAALRPDLPPAGQPVIQPAVLPVAAAASLASFDANREAEVILAITDANARRIKLRELVITLTPQQQEELHAAIHYVKGQSKVPSWVDDV